MQNEVRCDPRTGRQRGEHHRLPQLSEAPLNTIVCNLPATMLEIRLGMLYMQTQYAYMTYIQLCTCRSRYR
jgi:hypothetical protein